MEQSFVAGGIVTDRMREGDIEKVKADLNAEYDQETLAVLERFIAIGPVKKPDRRLLTDGGIKDRALVGMHRRR